MYLIYLVGKNSVVAKIFREPIKVRDGKEESHMQDHYLCIKKFNKQIYGTGL